MLRKTRGIAPGVLHLMKALARIVSIEESSFELPADIDPSKDLQKLVLEAISLPHSNADSEYIFSQINLIKTMSRNKIVTATITVNTTLLIRHIPHYCSLSFDYGTCFGSFDRWGWDKLTKNCKRYLYSGCGGNQNNFLNRADCLNTCLYPANNTAMLQGVPQITTCIPLNFIDA
ncbi:unnamed protein product [Parnassius apollo]|uniref:(apollo) hypothetical protein n=1 Tax=Parnassius apollo TaxID=110799 RepID=A0A8S3VZQ4_PARAO|nr:unnamed protein product [Parnassius apollo]